MNFVDFNWLSGGWGTCLVAIEVFALVAAATLLTAIAIMKMNPLLDRLRVAWRNWQHRHVGEAYRTLTQAMRDDPSYAKSWQANIAMPIYDATRPVCNCQFNLGHEAHCAMVAAHDWGNHPMHLDQANDIADRLMQHLFGVPMAPATAALKLDHPVRFSPFYEHEIDFLLWCIGVVEGTIEPAPHRATYNQKVNAVRTKLMAIRCDL